MGTKKVWCLTTPAYIKGWGCGTPCFKSPPTTQHIIISIGIYKSIYGTPKRFGVSQPKPI